MTDMARGRGEHLDAFAQLIQVRPEHRTYFGSFTQQHLAELIPHDHVSSDEMLVALTELMAADPTLAGYVRG